MGVAVLSKKVPKLKPPVALPSGFTPLVYIQSTGTQYINTGCAVPFSLEATVQSVSVPSGSSVMFSMNGGTNAGQWFGGVPSNVWTLGDNTTFAKAYTDKTTLTAEWTSSGVSVTIDGVTKSKSGSPAGNLYVGSPKSNFPAHCKIYKLKIYVGGTLVRDFVPCISNADTVGLYDLVEGKFYGSMGSGNFIGSEVA